MRTYTSAAELQQEMLAARRSGERIALVPTMGCLHAGHGSLMRLARRQCDRLVVSIFVNPSQFGPDEDLDTYPRDFERDAVLCRDEQADIIFYPSADEMYARDHSVFIDEDTLSVRLCGASRPGHFRGVCTVVAKLFNIVQPHAAVFGRKDYQQLQVIRRMVRDLDMPVEIVAAPIVREEDGLALSSRNRYLSPDARRQALCLRAALNEAERLYAGGERDSAAVAAAMRDVIARAPLAEPDYVELVNADNLEPVTVLAGPTLAALAVVIDGTRLIDNVVLG